MKKNIHCCIRCEALGRDQASNYIIYKEVLVGNKKDLVPFCSVCISEIAEEEWFLSDLIYEQGSESEIEEDC